MQNKVKARAVSANMVVPFLRGQEQPDGPGPRRQNVWLEFTDLRGSEGAEYELMNAT